MADDWLIHLQKLHNADKADQESQQPPPKPQPEKNKAAKLLRRCQAHKLLRQVQKTLLAGGGVLDIFEEAGKYDRAIALVWQGTISRARKPNPEDPAAYYYIMVGVRQERVWVNHRPLPAATPEALKKALLAASQKPGHQKEQSR